MKRFFTFLMTTLTAMFFLTGCVSTNNAATDFSGNDLMFAAMMVPHHQQAIEMSDLALQISKDPEVITLAQEIKAAQGPEIAEMKSWGDLDSQMHMGHMMNGMLSDDEMLALRNATAAEFDKLFLEGMIKHHQGAIEMAEMVVDSSNNRAAKLGRSIIKEQKAEIAKMQEMLAK